MPISWIINCRFLNFLYEIYHVRFPKKEVENVEGKYKLSTHVRAGALNKQTSTIVQKLEVMIVLTVLILWE